MKRSRDLPLGKEPSARLVPWIIALMIYLGCLLMGATFYTIGQAHHWESQLGASVTIEVPLSKSLSSATAQERVFSIVNQMKGVKSVQVVSQDEIQTLLKSWIPENSDVTSLPLPLIVDVALEPHAKIDLAHLENLLKTISLEVHLVDHRPWIQEVQNVIWIVISLSSIILGFLLICITFTTIFATRTSLLIHRQIIEVLHLIGATPTYISRQFDTHALKDGLIAGFSGVLLAIMTLGALYLLLQGIDLEISASPSFIYNTILSFLLAPFLIAILMMITARRTVYKTLAFGAY
ncbi:Cell division ATP-binding protein FtsX [Candidatus Bealeia paramacronuclearis]|uniref:Cell division ATP-binding protein FtsX n=1 Tax=Candidatus Bealeia paramacronuclearis TaxID=1921001 RepID=A0ABZ2C3G1_9PROT|nr:Cell division ATP-binding protein FtsX [Candidatus Bealeia paramacronuclearis]